MFEGTDRYRVRKRLGAGGMGVVYEVDDLLRGLPVALKTLRGQGTADRITRLKAEFRSLADVAHPNLVGLYELEHFSGLWFFTMELLRGKSLARLLKNAWEPAPLKPTPSVELETENDELPTEADGVMSANGPVPRYSDSPLAGIDPRMLAKLFAQIARGVSALHDRAKLHRDLKPSNVIIEHDGRAVILDFGLVSDRDVRVDGPALGTPAYMAPEQALGHTLTEASDWYALGAMLYQALTGQLPFGTGSAAIHAKLTRPAASLAIRADVPSELASLTDDLLRASPTERPTAHEILTRLHRTAGDSTSKSLGPSSPTPRRLPGAPVGRAKELDAIERSFRAAESGRLSLCLVAGPPGIGKSEVLSYACRQRSDRDAFVLAGRCFDRENVPYKMLDPLIDALVAHLSSNEKDRATLNELDLDGAAALVRMFPAFDGLIAKTKNEALGELEARTAGFRALLSLLRQMRAAQPIVLWIDDVQWGDADSLGFFGELLGESEPPALMIIASGRTTDSSFHRWLDDLPPGSFNAVVARFDVGPLDREASLELALSELPGRGPGAQARAERIAEESGGSPLWIRLLAGTEKSEASLDEVIWSRVESLEERERYLVFTACIAIRPLDETISNELLGGSGALQQASGRPRAELLIKTEWEQRKLIVAPFHERVREIVLEHLSRVERVGLHSSLAACLEKTSADLELLAFHHQGAGETEKATEYARRAADGAFESLAFERAASLYELALTRVTTPQSERVELLEKLGRSFALAGRRAQAGRVLLEASELSVGKRRLDLRRQSLRSYLLAGYIAESLRAVESDLERIGFSIPRGGRASLAGAMLYKARGSMIRVVERPDDQVDRDQLEALELMWDVSISLSVVEPILSAKFFGFHEWLAKKSGSRSHLMRAMSADASVLGSLGRAKDVDKLREKMRALGRRMGPSSVDAEAVYGLAIGDLYLGRWGEGYRGLLESRRMFSKARGVPPEIGWSQALITFACYQLGRVREGLRWVAQGLVDSEARGDLWSQIVLRTAFANGLRLTVGDPTKAESAVDEAERLCAEHHYSLMDGWNLYARCQIDLFREDPLLALERLEKAWPHLEANFYLHVSALRITTFDVRGRAALLAWRRSKDERHRLRAQRDAKKLRREGTLWSIASAVVLEAAFDPNPGERLREAEAAFERADMIMHANLVRRRRGQLIGGDTGRALIEATDRWASDEGVTAIEVMTRILVPA